MRLKGLESLSVLIPLYVLFTYHGLPSGSLFKRDTASFTYDTPQGILGIWTSYTKVIRIAARFGQTMPGLTSYGPLITYYLPVIILLGILLVGLILMLFFSSIMICSACCCRGRLSRKYKVMSKRPTTKGRKNCAIGFFSIQVILVAICIYINHEGSTYLTTALIDTQNSSLRVLTDSATLLAAFVPAVSVVLDSLSAAVNTSIDLSVGAVNFGVFASTVNPPMNSLINGLFSVETLKEQILSNASIMTTNTTALSSSASTLATQCSSISSAISGLNTFRLISGNPSPADSWKVTATQSTNVDGSAINATAQGIPSATSIFSSLSTSANLTISAIAANSTLNSAVTTANATVQSSSANIKSSTAIQLGLIKTSISNTYDSISSTIPIAFFRDTLNTNFKTINTYNEYRVNGQLGLALLSALALILIIAFAMAKKPGFMKGTNLMFTPYYVVLFVLAIVTVLLSVVTGDVCTGVFDNSNSTIAKLIPPLTQINAVIDGCYNNQSILQVATTVGVVSASQVDFVGLASGTINTTNFTGVANFDLTSALSLSSDPAADANSVTNINLGAISIVPFTSINSNTAIQDSNLSNLRVALVNARTYASSSNLTFTGTPTNPVKAQAVIDYQNAITGIIVQVDSARASIVTINTLSTTLSASFVSTNTTALLMISTAQGLPALYNQSTAALVAFSSAASTNISSVIPIIKSNIFNAITTGSATINTALSCQQIAVDIYGVRQGVCGEMMSGLDSMSSTLTILAFLAFLSLPLTVFLANALFLKFNKIFPSKDNLNGDESKDEIHFQNPNIIGTREAYEESRDQKPNFDDEIRSATRTRQREISTSRVMSDDFIVRDYDSMDSIVIGNARRAGTKLPPVTITIT